MRGLLLIPLGGVSEIDVHPQGIRVHVCARRQFYACTGLTHGCYVFGMYCFLFQRAEDLSIGKTQLAACVGFNATCLYHASCTQLAGVKEDATKQDDFAGRRVLSHRESDTAHASSTRSVANPESLLLHPSWLFDWPRAWPDS